MANPYRISIGITLAGLFFSCPWPARADDSPFAYTYTTDSLPKGAWEYEQWNYLGTEQTRHWTSLIHSVLGLIFAPLLLLHVLLARR